MKKAGCSGPPFYLVVVSVGTRGSVAGCDSGAAGFLAGLHRVTGLLPGLGSAEQCVCIRDPFLLQFVYQTGT